MYNASTFSDLLIPGYRIVHIVLYHFEMKGQREVLSLYFDLSKCEHCVNAQNKYILSLLSHFLIVASSSCELSHSSDGLYKHTGTNI